MCFFGIEFLFQIDGLNMLFEIEFQFQIDGSDVHLECINDFVRSQLIYAGRWDLPFTWEIASSYADESGL